MPDASAGPAYDIIDHTYDVVVVGAGGAGLRATFGMEARSQGKPSGMVKSRLSRST